MRNFLKRANEKDSEYKDKRDSFEFEKGDGLALFVAAMVTFLPALLLVVGLFLFIVWLFLK